mgnify:FL=1
MVERSLFSSQINSFAISCNNEIGFNVAFDFRLSFVRELLIASPTESTGSELSDNRRFLLGY